MNNEISPISIPDEQLIIVRQLPIIEEQLYTIKAFFKEKVAEVLALPCTEDTVQEVKKARAEINRIYAALEEKRKAAKEAIMAPYNDLEKVYRECVTDIYKPSVDELADKISAVENELKSRKRIEVEEYFNEYCASKSIDFVGFDAVGLNITLTASKKSLKEKVKAFVDKVCDDLELIGTQPYCEEILVEYKVSLNSAKAILLVNNRHKAIEAEQRKMEALRAFAEDKQQATEKVEKTIEAMAPPVQVPQPVSEPIEPSTAEAKLYEVAFKVVGTMVQIKALKEFLEKGAYQYEQQ